MSINIAANFGAKALIAADSYCLRENVTPVLAQNSEGPRKAGDICTTALPSRA
jgi:hypothetical protein